MEIWILRGLHGKIKGILHPDNRALGLGLGWVRTEKYRAGRLEDGWTRVKSVKKVIYKKY